MIRKPLPRALWALLLPLLLSPSPASAWDRYLVPQETETLTVPPEGLRNLDAHTPLDAGLQRHLHERRIEREQAAARRRQLHAAYPPHHLHELRRSRQLGLLASDSAVYVAIGASAKYLALRDVDGEMAAKEWIGRIIDGLDQNIATMGSPNPEMFKELVKGLASLRTEYVHISSYPGNLDTLRGTRRALETLGYFSGGAILVEYRHPVAGFVARLPGDWPTEELHERRPPSHGVQAFCLTGPAANFIENVIVLQSVLDSTTDMATLAHRSIEVFRKAKPRSVAGHVSSGRLGRKPAAWYRITYRTPNRTEITQQFYLLSHAGFLYHVIGTTLPSQAREFEPIFRAVAENIGVQ